MRRALIIAAIFLLGFETSQLTNSLRSQKLSEQPLRFAAITNEATSTAQETSRGEYVLVTRVIDGDTIELSDGRRVRYIGIDTPETVDPRRPVQCFGKEASQENKRLVDGKTVRLEKDVSETDKYGRLLRYVYVGDEMINTVLVREGFAVSSTFPPDVKHQELFLQAQQEAREHGRGLWATCIEGLNSTISPSVEGVRSTQCTIKGNISGSGEKIYHLPGCGSYDKTSIDEGRGERWFCSEDEAAAAGWRKAKNCP